MSNAVLIFIILSICLILLGGTIAIIRGARFIRKKRVREHEIRARFMTEARKIRKDVEMSSETTSEMN